MLPFCMNSKVHEHARPKLFGFQLLVSRLQRVLKWIEVGSQKKYRIFNKSSQHLYLLVLRNACPHDELEECYICFWTHLLLVLVFWSCQRSFGCWPPVSVLQRTGHAGDSVKSLLRTNKRWQTIQIINFCAGRPSGCHGSTALWAELPACPMKS